MDSKTLPTPLVSNEWLRLAQQATLKNEWALAELYQRLRPGICRLARNLASQLVDDAMQAGEIAVWKTLPKIDYSRPTTIRGFLMKAAFYAIRDEIRRYLRVTTKLVYMDPADVCDPEQHEHTQHFSYNGVLALYFEYVKRNNEFAGAHKHVAGLLGMKLSMATALFNEEAASFSKKHKLSHGRGRTKSIIAVLKGDG